MLLSGFLALWKGRGLRWLGDEAVFRGLERCAASAGLDVMFATSWDPSSRTSVA